MRVCRNRVWILLAACAMGAIACASAAAQERNAAPSDTTAMTLQEARQMLAQRARSDGWWVTSNAAYVDEGADEWQTYAMRYVSVPGGLAITGCLWGETEGEVGGPFWYFYAAWDPVARAILVYQSSPGGAVAIGHQRRSGETVQTLQGPEGPPLRIRHESVFAHPDTLRNRSFQEEDGAWRERRRYTWVWTAAQGREAPC